MWQSADPALEKYLPERGQRVRLSPPDWSNEWRVSFGLPGMGGVIKPHNLGLYSYGHSNPIRYSDPDGNAVCGGICVGIGVGLARASIWAWRAWRAHRVAVAGGTATGVAGGIVLSESSEDQEGQEVDLDDPDVIEQSEKEIEKLKELPSPSDSRNPDLEKEYPGTADELLDSLTGGKVEEKPGGRKVKTLPGGRIAVQHPSSSREGQPTVTIQRPGSKKAELKIRTRRNSAEE